MAVMGLLAMAGCAPTGRHPPQASGVPGGPAAPKLIQPPSPTKEERIPIEGYAGPGERIELFVNSVLEGESLALSDGRFLFPSVRLQMGPNTITAVAIDSEGRRSSNSPSGGGERAGSESVLRPEVRVVRE